MIKMQSPTPNRKGVYEIHDVPTRKIEGLKVRGWTPVETSEEQAFDLNTAPWFEVRQKVKEELGLETSPKSKQQAYDLLEQAGYKVTE